MLDEPSFETRFEALTDHRPFPWQVALYKEFIRGKFAEACDIPTGLGKTSIIAIWLIALAERGGEIPRRLVYVVNRRTVVDQSTNEAESIRKRLLEPESDDARPEIIKARRDLADALSGLTARPESGPLAISTLRGQFADNREWSADPSRPAVIVGTVDMIGSRLLFGGYGIGFKTRPLHAGFLGIDALLVHDEAHLEPAFQKLIVAIRKEQDREFEKQPDPLGEAMRLKVMALTATPRGGETFKLTDEDRTDPRVRKRIQAKKSVVLTSFKDYDSKDKLADKLAGLALTHQDSKRAVIIFARTVEVVEKVAEKLQKEKMDPRVLIGTMRGKERDGLIEDRIFKRFLPEAKPGDETAYLVCTSAGEVGVNISADHLVCDLSTFESMAQRFGRVNRFGERDDTKIDIVYPEKIDEKDPIIKDRLEKTLDLLSQLKGDGSPDALSQRDAKDRLAAFSPDPEMLETSDILFDAWSLTTIRDELPGRPPLEPYLHGVIKPQDSETQVAWREDVQWLSGPRWEEKERTEFLEAFPLKPYELLRDRSDRVFRQVEAISKQLPAEPPLPVWLIDRKGKVQLFTIQELADKDQKDRLDGCTLLLPPRAGGLSKVGLLDGNSKEIVRDVSTEWMSEAGPRRARFWDEDKKEIAKNMRLIRTIDIKLGIDDDEEDEKDEPSDGLAEIDDESGEESGEGKAERDSPGGRRWHWYEAMDAADSEGSENAKRPVLWEVHTKDVVRIATEIVERLPIPDKLKSTVVLVALLHDFGKKRPTFQREIGNLNPDRLLAKSGKKPGKKSGKKKEPIDIGGKFRHEFGSLLDFEKEVEIAYGIHLDPHRPIPISLLEVEKQEEIKQWDDDQFELARHLLPTHHGRGRPHFSADEAFDPGHRKDDVYRVSSEVPRRFARLQRKYGRWGLAYLESLLRAADYAASADPSEFVEDES